PPYTTLLPPLTDFGTDGQGRADQQLYRVCRATRRPGAKGQRPLFQGTREGSAAGRQDRDLDARRQILLVFLEIKVVALLPLVGGLRDKPGIAVDQPDLDRLCQNR